MMPEVRWIKLSVDMFDNRKLKHLRKLPDGNNIVLIWVMLLTMAGRCNAGGMIFLTENIPYTAKMLADELDFEESVVCLALEAMANLGMVEYTDGGFLNLPGWEEHQSAEKLAAMREYNRLAKQRSREKQKLLQQVNDVSMTCQSCQDTELEEEKNKKKNKKSEKSENNADKPRSRSRFVPPTLDEVKAYCDERHSSVDPVRFWEYFDAGDWKDSKGQPVKNWKQKLITWEQHSNAKGGVKNDGRTGNNRDSISAWNINYSVDGREL